MKNLLAALVVAAVLAAGCGAADDAATDSEESFGADVPAAESASGGEGGSDDVETASEATTVAADEGASEDAEALSDVDASGDDAEEASDEAVEEAAADAVEEAERAEAEERAIQAGTLTAADIDDNLNFEFFNSYIKRTQDGYNQSLPSVRLDDRVIINAVDPDGAGLPNARIEANGITTGYTNATGTSYLYPSLSGVGDWDELQIAITPADEQGAGEFVVRGGDIDEDGSVTLTVENSQAGPPAALDVALVIDTTGSMGDELNYLTTEFTSIVDRLAEQYPNVDMRFALIVYRDDTDDYITRVYEFTDNVFDIQTNLREQSAEGGGDYPEAMDAALAEAVDLDWRSGDVARVMIVNADAPPHDNGFSVALDATDAAREAGIRIYPLAASGVGDTAEYLMRLMAATTGGRHLFLTDDSGVGAAHQEPKVQCYVVSRLDHLLVRILSSEVSAQRLEPFPEQLIRTVGDYDNGYCSDAG